MSDEVGGEPMLSAYEARRLMLGFGKSELDVSPDEYRVNKSPRFGVKNPEKMDIEFWNEMVRCGFSAWQARSHFSDVDDTEDDRPVWSHNRFGCSLTHLPDGRFVEIGGEHEDYYDEDFYIYNDVIVHFEGRGFSIFCYPESEFQQTDFHSASIVGDFIYIIGGLGYSEKRRYGETPVYRLDCFSMKIDKVVCFGDAPGWIHMHVAEYFSELNSIVVTGGKIAVSAGEICENTSQYLLNVSSGVWKKHDD